MDGAIKKSLTCLLSAIFFFNPAKAQYSFVAQNIVPNGQIRAIKQNWAFNSTNQNGTYYSKLPSREFPITYIYNGDCGKFEIRGTIFELNKYFEDGLACDLDLSTPEMYQFYKFSFDKRKYIALRCIKNGSGSATSFIFIHLFQISKDSIFYYPLWSRYGSIACLGDFNKDKVLDFLKIRNNEIQTGTDTFKASLMSLDSLGTKFNDLPQSTKWYFKKVYTKNNNIRIKAIKPSNPVAGVPTSPPLRKP